jgi:ABC-type uncharacterized transport system involved in gliding motility auxiliary subunit
MQTKSIQTILYSSAGVIAMALVLVALNVIVGRFRVRVDLTREKAYTLSEGTRAILRRLDSPVKVRFYCTQSEAPTPVTVYLRDYARQVEDLLAEYQQVAGDKLVVERFDPQPDSDAEDSARLDGLEAQSLPSGEKFYLGLAVSLLDSRQTLPFLSPARERQLEYDLSRAISRVVTPDRQVVGLMSPLPVFGLPSNPMMMQMGQRGQEPWAIVSELQQDFTVKSVPMDTDGIDPDIRVLLVIHPRDISDRAQYAIDQFVLRGGKLLAFLDAQSLVDSRGQNPMLGAMPGGGSSLDKLLKAWGLQFDVARVVADRNFQMELGESGDLSQQKPAWLAVTPDGLNTNDLTTAELDNLWLFAAGAFTGRAAPGLSESVLIKSTTDSQLVEGTLAAFSGESILKDFKPSGVEYALAVRLTGRFKTAFPEGKPPASKADGAETPSTNAPAAKPDEGLKESRKDSTVILVGDADMIYDGYALRRVNSPFGTLAMPMNANLSFVQNAVEQLAGDDNLIGVRSRAVLNHPFTRVRKIEAEADAQYLAKIKQLQESRDQAVTRLNELQKQKSQNQRYILSPEQSAELESLRRQEADISRELRQVDKNRRREIVSLQRRVQVFNLAAVPLTVCLAGISLAIYKRKRTGAK